MCNPWRKVNVPLQVGEALSVDCSFGSAGGNPVPFTAAAGTRHRHPWLFPLTCGEGGRVEAETSKEQPLKAFEIQLVSAISGICEFSLKASLPAQGNQRVWAGGGKGGSWVREPSAKLNVDRVPGSEEWGNVEMHKLEKYITRLQHSVFWEGVFETIKAEALIDGKDGWLVHQDARFSLEAIGKRKTREARMVSNIEVGAKRMFLSGMERGTATVTHNEGNRVVHVVDDEVMVELDREYLLGYRLVSDEVRFKGSGKDSVSSVVSEQCGLSTEEGRLEKPARERLASLGQLALLYCGSLIRQRQQTQAEAVGTFSSKPGTDRKRGKIATFVENEAGIEAAGQHSVATSTWKSVGRVLLHHLHRLEVKNIISSLRGIGLIFVGCFDTL